MLTCALAGGVGHLYGVFMQSYAYYSSRSNLDEILARVLGGSGGGVDCEELNDGKSDC